MLLASVSLILLLACSSSRFHHNPVEILLCSLIFNVIYMLKFTTFFLLSLLIHIRATHGNEVNFRTSRPVRKSKQINKVFTSCVNVLITHAFVLPIILSCLSSLDICVWVGVSFRKFFFCFHQRKSKRFSHIERCSQDKLRKF